MLGVRFFTSLRFVQNDISVRAVQNDMGVVARRGGSRTAPTTRPNIPSIPSIHVNSRARLRCAKGEIVLGMTGVG